MPGKKLSKRKSSKKRTGSLANTQTIQKQETGALKTNDLRLVSITWRDQKTLTGVGSDGCVYQHLKSTGGWMKYAEGLDGSI